MNVVSVGLSRLQRLGGGVANSAGERGSDQPRPRAALIAASFCVISYAAPMGSWACSSAARSRRRCRSAEASRMAMALRATSQIPLSLRRSTSPPHSSGSSAAHQQGAGLLVGGGDVASLVSRSSRSEPGEPSSVVLCVTDAETAHPGIVAHAETRSCRHGVSIETTTPTPSKHLQPGESSTSAPSLRR